MHNNHYTKQKHLHHVLAMDVSKTKCTRAQDSDQKKFAYYLFLSEASDLMYVQLRDN